MTIDPAVTELLHDVLDGRADAAARARFERLCAERPALAEEFALLRSIRAATLELGTPAAPEALRRSVAAAVRGGAAPSGAEPPRVVRRAWWAPAAAAAAAILTYVALDRTVVDGPPPETTSGRVATAEPTAPPAGVALKRPKDGVVAGGADLARAAEKELDALGGFVEGQATKAEEEKSDGEEALRDAVEAAAPNPADGGVPSSDPVVEGGLVRLLRPDEPGAQAAPTTAYVETLHLLDDAVLARGAKPYEPTWSAVEFGVEDLRTTLYALAAAGAPAATAPPGAPSSELRKDADDAKAKNGALAPASAAADKSGVAAPRTEREEADAAPMNEGAARDDRAKDRDVAKSAPIPKAGAADGAKPGRAPGGRRGGVAGGEARPAGGGGGGVGGDVDARRSPGAPATKKAPETSGPAGRPAEFERARSAAAVAEPSVLVASGRRAHASTERALAELGAPWRRLPVLRAPPGDGASTPGSAEAAAPRTVFLEAELTSDELVRLTRRLRERDDVAVTPFPPTASSVAADVPRSRPQATSGPTTTAPSSGGASAARSVIRLVVVER